MASEGASEVAAPQPVDEYEQYMAHAARSVAEAAERAAAAARARVAARNAAAKTLVCADDGGLFLHPGSKRKRRSFD